MSKRIASGMRYRHDQGVTADLRRIDPAPALLFPLERTVASIAVAGGPLVTVDRSEFVVVPADTEVRIHAKSSITRLLTLWIEPEAIARAAREYEGHVVAARLREYLSSAWQLTRTRWVDELASRYLFERQICEKHTSPAARFLETELTKEVFFLCKEHASSASRASTLYEGNEVVNRGRQWIEDHLFEPLKIGALARHCNASASTLLRCFQRSLGMSPIDYLRQRRLEEARLLLRSGRHGVGEVAAKVGYASLAAFTVAFRRAFGAPPSSVLGAAPTLPPHGEPPVVVTKGRGPRGTRSSPATSPRGSGTRRGRRARP